MNNKTKYFIGSIGVLGVLGGRNLNRIFPNYSGYDSSNIIFAGASFIILCAILALIIMKQYIVAIIAVVMAIPVVIMGVGIYLDNMGVLAGGILSFFIIYPILSKIIPRLKLNK